MGYCIEAATVIGLRLTAKDFADYHTDSKQITELLDLYEGLEFIPLTEKDPDVTPEYCISVFHSSVDLWGYSVCGRASTGLLWSEAQTEIEQKTVNLHRLLDQIGWSPRPEDRVLSCFTIVSGG